MISKTAKLKAEYDAAEYALISAKAERWRLVTLATVQDISQGLLDMALARVQKCEVDATEAYLRCEEQGITVTSHQALMFL